MATNHPIKDMLTRLEIIDPDKLEVFHHRVRDRDDIQAWRCQRSGVVFLSRCDHTAANYYAAKPIANGIIWGKTTATPPPLENDRRRAQEFAPLIVGRRWLDFGAGHGGALDLLGPQATAAGLEPNDEQRAAAIARGHHMYAALDGLGEARFDIITLFHVIEHLPDPIGILQTLRSHLRPGGEIIIEAPHARDALLTTFDCPAFKDFTLWSEHLILHTRDSLAAIIRAAGLAVTSITGRQRYPLSNHLYWLRRGQPGGHSQWPFLSNPELDRQYEAALAAVDQTDTLIVRAQTASVTTG